MRQNFMFDVLQKHLESGYDPAYWWDEERIPLGSIDKRVSELLDLTGRTAVVTGGAGLNLGQAIVNRLAGLGAEVAVVDMAPEKAEAFARKVGRAPKLNAEGVAAAAAEKWGAKTFHVYGDVMQWDGIQAVMKECAERLGRIDILVNSAIDLAPGYFADRTPDEIMYTVNGTYTGTVLCCRAALDHMIPRQSGRIINIGSAGALSAHPGFALYNSLKAGINSFTVQLQKEVMQHGIKVLGVNPGAMWGPNRELLPDSPESLLLLGRTVIQRFELPEEVANMVAFLASDAASAMAGTMVDMSGGMSI